MCKKNIRLTVRQIQILDKIAIEQFGIPSLALMENAGRSVACEILKQVKRIKKPNVCILCGIGNNAGDGFVAARHLINTKIKVKILLAGKSGQLKGDAAVNYKILKKLKCSIYQIGHDRRRFEKEIQKADVVVDAIFGVGLNRDILDPYRSIVERINKCRKKVISIDTPSGLNATNGEIFGICVKADTTVTFSYAKTGFFKNKGKEFTGKVVVEDIGIPHILSKKLY